MSEEQRLAAREEHAAWRKLCFELKTRGVVTEQDLQAPVSSNSTPGRRLLNAIRDWAELHAALAAHGQNNERSKCR